MHASASTTTTPGEATASTEAVASDLGLLLKHVLGSSSRDFFAAIEQTGLTFTQLKCLHILADADEPLPFSALSEYLGLSAPAISRAVDGLVQRGEVKRTEDPRDRRSKLLTVSARGQRTVERFMALRFAGVKRFVEGLTEAERQALAAGLGPIVRRLD